MLMLHQLRAYAAVVAPENDVVDQIGGAPNVAKKHDFTDFEGDWQVVSSQDADTTEAVVLTYRHPISKEILTADPVLLTGHTPAEPASPTPIDRIMKASKTGPTLGDVAVESTTAERTGTAQGAGPRTNTIQLDAGASSVNGFYTGMVIRITAGTGAGDLAQIIAYVGATKVATVSKEWVVDDDSEFRIAPGVVFNLEPNEITDVVRLFYDAEAEAETGSERKYYQKFYFMNTSTTDALLTASVAEAFDGAEEHSADILFDLDPTVNDDSDNGEGNNRMVAPDTGIYTFDEVTQTVPGGTLQPGDYIGVWLELTVPAGGDAFKDVYIPRLAGTTA